jgi:hypothetical protein
LTVLDFNSPVLVEGVNRKARIAKAAVRDRKLDDVREVALVGPTSPLTSAAGHGYLFRPCRDTVDELAP